MTGMSFNITVNVVFDLTIDTILSKEVLVFFMEKSSLKQVNNNETCFENDNDNDDYGDSGCSGSGYNDDDDDLVQLHKLFSSKRPIPSMTAYNYGNSVGKLKDNLLIVMTCQSQEHGSIFPSRCFAKCFVMQSVIFVMSACLCLEIYGIIWHSHAS